METVLYNAALEIGRITLHRPEKRNALNADVMVASTMRWRVRPPTRVCAWC
jgi:enoyl-CoA hydratase/carnithine racemase